MEISRVCAISGFSQILSITLVQRRVAAPLAGFLMVTSIPYRRAAYSENQQSGYDIAVHEGGSSQYCA